MNIEITKQLINLLQIGDEIYINWNNFMVEYIVTDINNDYIKFKNGYVKTYNNYIVNYIVSKNKLDMIENKIFCFPEDVELVK